MMLRTCAALRNWAKKEALNALQVQMKMTQIRSVALKEEGLLLRSEVERRKRKSGKEFEPRSLELMKKGKDGHH